MFSVSVTISIFNFSYLTLSYNPILHERQLHRDKFNLYGADEFGWVRGEEQMVAEIAVRGPIACTINSHPDQFKHYSGGILTCDDDDDSACKGVLTHLVILAGYGVDKETGVKYWIGRNSYGTQVNKHPIELVYMCAVFFINF